MKVIKVLAATTLLIGGVAVASAQAPSKSQPESQQTIDSNKGDQMNPGGTPGGTRVNPSPEGSGTTGAGTTGAGQPNTGQSESQKTLESNQGESRNPGGSPGGSQTNPSPR